MEKVSIMEQTTINGIPIELKVYDGDVPRKSVVYFATVRKAPALAGIIKKLRKAERDEQRAMRHGLTIAGKFQALQEGLTVESSDPTAAMEALEKEADENQDAYMKAQDARISETQDLLVSGLKAAGYMPEDIEKYLPFFDPARIEEIVQRCLVGCGRLDFFSEKSPAERS